jgi:hypothetical protein
MKPVASSTVRAGAIAQRNRDRRASVSCSTRVSRVRYEEVTACKLALTRPKSPSTTDT